MDDTRTGGARLRRALARINPYLWLTPSLALMTAFVFIPVVETMLLAFCEVSKAGRIKGFAGLSNFSTLFSQAALPRVFLITLIWTVTVAGAGIVLGLIAALVFNERFHFRKLARTSLLLPWATSTLVTASIWKYILDYEFGPLNTILKGLGLIRDNIYFLGSADSAFIWMMVIGVLVSLPFITFSLLSGLQSIPRECYEAAEIDGASFWGRLFRITLPMLKSSLNVVIVMNVIYVFNSFTIVSIMTDGGPVHQTDMVMTYTYWLAFSKMKIGPASALSLMSFGILLVFSLLYMRTVMKEGAE